MDGIPHHGHAVLTQRTVARSLGRPHSASVLTAVVLIAAVLGAVLIAVITVVASVAVPGTGPVPSPTPAGYSTSSWGVSGG
jgi:hypothetical protein